MNLSHNKHKRMFLNDKLLVVAASPAMLALLKKPLDQVVGKKLSTITAHHTQLMSIAALLFESQANPSAFIENHWKAEPLRLGEDSLGWLISFQEHNSQQDPLIDDFLNYLDNIAESMPGNFYWKDRNGYYLGCNRAVSEMMNFSQSDIIGKTDFDLWPNQAEQLQIHDKSVMTSGRTLCFQESVTRIDGEHSYAVVKTPLRSRQGKIVGIIGNSLDITKTIALQEQFRQEKVKAEADSRAQSEFIANMSRGYWA